MTGAGRLEPPVGQGAEPFWEGTRDRQLLLPWCTACRRPFFYPRPFCPVCLGRDIAWRRASGNGSVYAFTVEHRTEGVPFAGDSPFVVGLVALDEGVRLMANVVGCPTVDVRVGMAVTVSWEALSDGRHLPLFTPQPGERAS